MTTAFKAVIFDVYTSTDLSPVKVDISNSVQL